MKSLIEVIKSQTISKYYKQIEDIAYKVIENKSPLHNSRNFQTIIKLQIIEEIFKFCSINRFHPPC